MSVHPGALIVIAITSGALGGCLEREEGCPADGPNCFETDDAVGAAPVSDPQPANGPQEEAPYEPPEPIDPMWLSKCTGFAIAVESDRARVEAMVGPDFTVEGETPASASVLLRALHCDRHVTTEGLAEDVALLVFLARAHPINETWSDSSNSFVVIQVLAQSELAYDWLSRMGSAVERARLNQTGFLSQALPGATRAVAAWEFRAQNGTHGERWVRFDVPSSSGGTGQRTHRMDHWIPDGKGYTRIEVVSSYEFTADPILPILVSASETYCWMSAMNQACFSAGVGNAWPRVDEQWTSGPQFFT